MTDKVTLTKVEYDTLVERAVFAEDRIRILRGIVRIRHELPTGIRQIRWRLRALYRVWQVLQNGTDPGEGE